MELFGHYSHTGHDGGEAIDASLEQFKANTLLPCQADPVPFLVTQAHSSSFQYLYFAVFEGHVAAWDGLSAPVMRLLSKSLWWWHR